MGEFIKNINAELEDCNKNLEFTHYVEKYKDMSVIKALFEFCVKYADHFSPQTCREIEAKYHFPQNSIKSQFYENLCGMMKNQPQKEEQNGRMD